MSIDSDPQVLPRTVYREAWRRDDPELERDAVDVWRRLKILPPSVAPEARAKELVCVADIDGEVNVALGLVGYSPEGRQIRMHWFRQARLDLPVHNR